MSIKEQEAQLFSEWRARHQSLVSDGVVDEFAYAETSPKLLFVLKEVNDLGGGGWDLRAYLRDEGGRPATWDNVTRWVEGIRNLPSDIPWQMLESIDVDRRKAALRSIAVMNIKKVPGGHTANPDEIAAAAETDQQFLLRQYELYRPDLTICCGTAEAFQAIQAFGSEPKWQSTQRGVWYYSPEPEKHVIAYSHPLARCAPPLLYYGLIDAVREILAR
ncbi:MAG TPA: uracil-DNA glycosylase family protein [Permianibacter sp.]|nr:uracil-DNA glycosylase family protein [Permianibacter sp.]